MVTLALLASLAISAVATVPDVVQPRAQVSFKAKGSTTWRNMDDRLADVVNVKDFGAKGDGREDDTAEIRAAVTALPATGGTLMFPPGTYKLSDVVTIAKPDTRVTGHAATLSQVTSGKGALLLTANRIVVEKLKLTSTTGAADWVAHLSVPGIDVYEVDGVRLVDLTVTNFARTQVRITRATNTEVRGCRLTGIGPDPDGVAPYTALVPISTDYEAANYCFGVELYGYGTYDGTPLTGYPGTRIVGNVIDGVGQGVFAYPDWNQLVITGNRITSIGQHGAYLDSPSNLVFSGNTITAPGHGVKCQIIGNPGSGVVGASLHDSENLAISGNAFDTIGQIGVFITPAVAGLTPRFKNVAITGNTIRNPGQDGSTDGIRLDAADGFAISGNTISGSAGYGIRLGNPTGGVGQTVGDGIIAGNVISETQRQAIYAEAGSTSFTVVLDGNVIVNPAKAGGAYYPVYLGIGNWVVRSNVIRSAVVTWANNMVAGATAVVAHYLNAGPTVRTDTGAAVGWQVTGTEVTPTAATSAQGGILTAGDWSRFSAAATSNRVLRSEEFDAASWVKVATNAPTGGNGYLNTVATLDPVGTNTAEKLTETATTNEHRFDQTVTTALDGDFHFVVYAKAAERSILYLRIGATGPQVDLSDGSILNTGGTTTTVTDAGNGWWRVATGKTLTAGAQALHVQTVDAYNSFNYAGVDGSGIYAWGAQFAPGLTPGVYAKTTATPINAFAVSAAQVDSVAADVATLKTDFNALLAKFRAAGLVAP